MCACQPCSLASATSSTHVNASTQTLPQLHFQMQSHLNKNLSSKASKSWQTTLIQNSIWILKMAYSLCQTFNIVDILMIFVHVYSTVFPLSLSPFISHLPSLLYSSVWDKPLGSLSLPLLPNWSHLTANEMREIWLDGADFLDLATGVHPHKQFNAFRKLQGNLLRSNQEINVLCLMQ